MYDSTFDSPDDTITKEISNIFDTSKLIMVQCRGNHLDPTIVVYLQMPCDGNSIRRGSQ